MTTAAVGALDPTGGVASGFDAALLALLPGDGEQVATVFDTGDLRISKFETGTDRAFYVVDYVDHTALIAGCGIELPDSVTDGIDLVLDCESNWPTADPVFVFRDGVVN